LLARTGMRAGKLADLEADAVVQIGVAHWLRIPLGKLRNDRYVPLHPSSSRSWKPGPQPASRSSAATARRSGRPGASSIPDVAGNANGAKDF
jgi:hypothetical protein